MYKKIKCSKYPLPSGSRKSECFGGGYLTWKNSVLLIGENALREQAFHHEPGGLNEMAVGASEDQVRCNCACPEWASYRYG